MWIYIWLGVTAAALIIEFITTEMVSVWFAGGGLVAMILAIFGVDWYVTVPVAIVVSFALMLAFRKLVMKKLSKGEVKTNAESVFGKEFILLSGTEDEGGSTIKINGVVWDVKTEDDTPLKKGDRVRVLNLEGNKYIVEEVK
ncbi:MAG: NfeD family protein [Clostridia bacterium]|nr:NfeD family protein [Clostridia bacterium]